MSLETLVTALRRTDDRSVTDQWVMNSRVWNQVGLEFVQINVESTIEAQRACDAADNLGDQSVEMLERWTWDIQVTAADIVNSFIVDQECAVAVLDGAVGGKYSVVGLDHGSADSWGRIDREF